MATTSTRPPAAPERSRVQRMQALQHANDVRQRRAKLKRDLKAGHQRFADLLMDPPEALASARVFDLLLHVPKVGRVKATTAFRQAGVSPSKTFLGITPAQVERLRAELGGRMTPPARAPEGRETR